MMNTRNAFIVVGVVGGLALGGVAAADAIDGSESGPVDPIELKRPAPPDTTFDDDRTDDRGNDGRRNDRRDDDGGDDVFIPVPEMAPVPTAPPVAPPPVFDDDGGDDDGGDDDGGDDD